MLNYNLACIPAKPRSQEAFVAESEPAAPLEATAEELSRLLGPHDANRKLLEELLGVRLQVREGRIAVVGDEIKSIKLSDYNGKWRVLCFYPADFTFV